MTLPNYCTLADVKASWPENEINTLTTYDAMITDELAEQSRTFDRMTNRKPGAYAVTVDTTQYVDGPNYNHFTPVYGYKTQRLTTGYTGAISLPIPEMAAYPTSVSMALTAQIDTGNSNNGVYTLVPATDYYAEPDNALEEGIPFRTLTLDIINGTTRVWYPFRRGIKIVGKFGYSTTVPDDVRKCVKLMVIRQQRKAKQNFLDVATINDAGQIMSGAKLDSDISDIVSRYRRMAI